MADSGGGPPGGIRRTHGRKFESRAVQELLGHKDVKTTMIHTQVLDRETLAKRCNHDLHEIVLDLQRRQRTPLNELVDRGRQTSASTVCREARQP